MKVYVLSLGERCNGKDCMGVYKTKKAAIKAGKELHTCFDGGWKKEKDEEVWSNGCDEWDVQEFEVE